MEVIAKFIEHLKFEKRYSPHSLIAYTGDLKQWATYLNELLQLSYEFRENLFIDLAVQQRNYAIEGNKRKNNTSLLTVGIRFNFMRREYE